MKLDKETERLFTNYIKQDINSVFRNCSMYPQHLINRDFRSVKMRNLITQFVKEREEVERYSELDAIIMLKNDSSLKFEYGDMVMNRVDDAIVIKNKSSRRQADYVIEVSNFKRWKLTKKIKNPYEEFVTVEELKEYGIVNLGVDTKVVVSESNSNTDANFKKRYLSHIHCGRFHCFYDGKTSWSVEPTNEFDTTTTHWNYIKII